MADEYQYRDRCRVVGGVDTHRDAHVAAALDPTGRLLGTASFAATCAGYGELWGWLSAWGDVDGVGVEGTSSYGAGLSRFLAAQGVAVVEVLRPRRRSRRGDKNDSADAVAAARSVLSGEASATPKSADGPVEAIRMLNAARRSAVKARTSAMNQIKGLAVTASEQVTAPLRGLPSASLITACSRLRPDPSGGEAAAGAKRSLRTLATRWQALSAEIDELDAEITRLCAAVAPALMGAPGVGPQVAAALLVTAGDNPQRLRSEASFAALCGVSPVEASSGRTVRHRLNRGGDRQANNALWRIATVRLRSDERTQAYAARRRAQGKTDREILRCLKRHIAREIHRLLVDPPEVPRGRHLRETRVSHGITLEQAANALGASSPKISALERGLRHDRDLAERYQQHLDQIAA